MDLRKSDFIEDLNHRLAAIRAEGLYRELRPLNSPQGPHIQIQNQSLVNFSSNDYLGLANDPLLRIAASQAVDRYGVGGGASRLICGTFTPHDELEQALASFKGTEAALAFSSGYTAALGTISALLGKNDIVIIDKLVHACIIDACRLSGASLRVFAHNDLHDLDEILRWADGQKTKDSPTPKPRVLVVTESVFSMDGDLAPLVEIVRLKEHYGAWLMVDEAHATGLYGTRRRGWAEACGVADQIEIQMGTLSKAIGSAGGYVCGSRSLIDFLVNRARSFIFSTSPIPASAAAATAAIGFIQSPCGEQRCLQLWQRVDQITKGLIKCGVKKLVIGTTHEITRQSGAIIPLLIGDELKAMNVASALRAHGILIPAIRYPTVARGAARLRLTISAAHTEADISTLLEALSNILPC